jgi:hypothetical protein
MLLRSILSRNPSLRLLPAAVRAARAAMSASASPASKTAVSVSVEYAKSGRAACKGCSDAIAKGALRLGAHARDPRGYDTTKWYHLACFPASSHPLGPVEEVQGFDSIKVCPWGGSGRRFLFRSCFVLALFRPSGLYKLRVYVVCVCRTTIARSCEGLRR